MTNAKRVMTVHSLAIAVLLIATTSWAQERAPILDKIAKTYGIDSWEQIEAIRYTWNGEIPGVFKLSHAWEWEPKTGKVSFEGTGKDGKPVKVTYDSSQLNSQSDQVKNEVEPAFVNDNYWLLFPLHAYWDKSATVTDQGIKKLPVDGYTPGDTWDLYVGKDNRVQAMVYRRGGNKPPLLVTASWTGYKKAGPLLFSTEHKGTADGKPLHIFHTNVAVKVTGSDKWMDAK